jgi:N-acetylglutamate synthase-like GNAT family acetyltransferase
MEIRPIRAGEAEKFLDLLCSVFGLDMHRAHRIFFTEPMFDLSRKWALFEGEEIISILTTVPLEFGWGKGMGIAGVATKEGCQGKGYARQLMEVVIATGENSGEGAAMLFARNPALYARLGFTTIDEVVRGPVECEPEEETEILDFHAVQQIYDSWALQNPARLRRDVRRWGYWRWNLRICTKIGDGYLCGEAGMVRECVTFRPVHKWPLVPDTEWFGLKSMATQLGMHLKREEHELYFMARNAPCTPQLFMTDQF